MVQLVALSFCPEPQILFANLLLPTNSSNIAVSPLLNIHNLGRMHFPIHSVPTRALSDILVCDKFSALQVDVGRLTCQGSTHCWDRFSLGWVYRMASLRYNLRELVIQNLDREQARPILNPKWTWRFGTVALAEHLRSRNLG